MAEQIAKLKKKQWYPIIAPPQFQNVVIGETPAYEPSELIGRTLTHSLMNLTNDMKKQNVNIRFKVVEVDGNNAKTSVVGYELVPSSIKRYVRRNSEKMDLSFACDTADNVFLRIKPLIITKADVKGSIAAKVRNTAVQFLVKTIKKMKFDELINDLVSHKMQETLRSSLNKIYPLKVCEIRYAAIESREKEQASEAEAKEEAQTPA